MNRKALMIAMSLSLPAFVAIGCNGVKQSHSISDESVLAEQPAFDSAVAGSPAVEASAEPVTGEGRETEMPVTDETASMLAEVDTQSTPQPPAVDVGQEQATQPDQLRFYFASNQTDVKQEDYEKLIAHAEYLIRHPDMKLKVSGHTDQSGSREYNQQLAAKRAQSVAAVLIEYGVQASQIDTESLGEQYPTSGYEHAIYDRRVELEYSAITRLTESSF